MTKLEIQEAKRINQQASEFALSIANQMLENMPPDIGLGSLAPTELLRFALSKVDEIMEHRRRFNEPHPEENTQPRR